MPNSTICTENSRSPLTPKWWALPAFELIKHTPNVRISGLSFLEGLYIASNSYHSNQLVWTPKRVHFYYIGMRAHQQLGALNHNHSVGREQARTATGEKRWKVVLQNAKKQWIAKVSGKTNGLLCSTITLYRRYNNIIFKCISYYTCTMHSLICSRLCFFFLFLFFDTKKHFSTKRG